MSLPDQSWNDPWAPTCASCHHVIYDHQNGCPLMYCECKAKF